MDTKLFNVILTGKFSEEKNIEEIVNQLSQTFKIEAEKVQKRILSNKAWVIKKNVKAEIAEALKNYFDKIGIDCIISQNTITNDVAKKKKKKKKKKSTLR
eukprot:TRINITY_DN68159_c0_g1_i1.p1 TRINITY_DN68159_c0_g1~~TRINITY_DN68159_c0_g1_i1.p1  ORF type:complete len:100 (+),score=36.16 TRINITY_DN68159_c0_g1_i1:529-828(+)